MRLAERTTLDVLGPVETAPDDESVILPYYDHAFPRIVANRKTRGTWTAFYGGAVIYNRRKYYVLVSDG